MKNLLGRVVATTISTRDDDRDLFVGQIVPDVNLPGAVDLLLRAELRVVDVYGHTHVGYKLPIATNKSFSDWPRALFSQREATVGEKYKLDAGDIANSSQLWPK